MKVAQHELEKAKDIADALTGESYTTGVATACYALVSNFADVLGQMEMFQKDKNGGAGMMIDKQAKAIEKCSQLIRCTRQIERANDLILRTIGWACAKKDFLSQEDQQEIIKNAEDIKEQVEKILKEVEKKE